MYRSATIAAYDCLEEVFVTAQVRTHDVYAEGSPTDYLTVSVQVKGTGEQSSARWLRDALVALAETL